MAADYIFIVGLHEGVLPKKAIPEESDICKFIVALTRTKKLCHILTCKNFSGTPQKQSPLIGWILKDGLNSESINAKKMTKYQL